MRRLLAVAAVLAGFAGIAVAGAAGEGASSGDYEVRGYFDSAGFLVPGEEVRVAGATVGTVAEVDVSRPGEPVDADGGENPGKAVVVMKIDDEAFQDFREDASCLIRPQSLLGEKYVDCQLTAPRAAGSEPPPSLQPVPAGDPGEGELFLPLQNNGKAVDLDLVNNITRETEVDRFRLIINDLGAGLAGRGEELGEVIERANPALRETDEVLAILAAQNRSLAQLARDSDTILTPLARERERVAGFIREAESAGAAAAERREDLERGFTEFPPALEQLESTMVELRGFARSGLPLARDLRTAAPAFTAATEELAPFSRAATDALSSLGDAAEAGREDLVASTPLIRDLGGLGRSTAGGAKALDRFLSSFRRTRGIDHLMSFILNGSNTFNGFDSYGHFLRAMLLVTNCVEYLDSPLSGCGANWAAGSSLSAARAPAPAPTKSTLRGAGESDRSEEPEESGAPERETDEDAAGEREGGNSVDRRASADLLDYLMEDSP